MYLLLVEFGYGILIAIGILLVVVALANIPTMISNWRYERRSTKNKDE